MRWLQALIENCLLFFFFKVQVALNEAKLSEEKVKSELRHVQEENGRLKKRKEQVSISGLLFFPLCAVKFCRLQKI